MKRTTITGFMAGRLAVLPVVLFGVSVITFLLIRLVPVEPAEVILRLSNLPATGEAVALMREELGLDKPLLVQYGLWLQKMLRLDFGQSFVSKMPIAGEIAGKFPATLELALAAMVLTLLISVPLGILSALYKNSWLDQLTRLLAFTGASMPRFWLGFLLIYWFSLQFDLFPTQGKGTWLHLVLPALTLSFSQIAVFTRLLRSNILDNWKEPYVLYARARGLKDRDIISRHILRHALLPVVTALGISTGNLLGGSVMVEQIFGWPGLGRYLIESIMNRDYPVIQCYAMLMAVVFLGINLIVDTLQRVLDPRTAGQEGGRRL